MLFSFPELDEKLLDENDYLEKDSFSENDFEDAFEDIEDEDEIDDTLIKGNEKDEDESIMFYLKEISNFKLLNADEEKELSKRVLNGDEEAFKKLVNSNLRLVVKIAKKYVSQDYPLIDIIQDGNLGLIHACKKFDYKHDVRFSTYASFWIKQTIHRSLSLRKRIIRLPHRKEEKLRKINKLLSSFYQKYLRYPTVGELSDQVGLKREEIDRILIAASNVISIENHIGDDENYLFKNLVSDINYIPENLFIDSNLKDCIEEMLDSLYTKEKMILTFRFGLFDGKKVTLKEMGEIFGISAETVRQIELKALKKIKKSFYHLKEYILK